MRVTVPAGRACMVTAHEIESGESSDPCHCEVSGELGEGSGKWQLSVTTDQSIQVMSVLKTPEHLTNLSTVRYAGFAPPDGAAFNARFVGRRVRATDGSGYVDFVSSGRFSESDDDGMYEGDYTYKNEGPNSGTLVFDYEDGEKCTALAAFDSFIAGTTLSVCEDRGVTERQPIRSWVLEDIGPAGMAPADQAAFDALVDSRRLAHDDPSWLGGVAVVFVSPGEFSQGTGGRRANGNLCVREHRPELGDGGAHLRGRRHVHPRPRVRGGRLGQHGVHVRRRVEQHDGRLDKLASRVRRRGRPRARTTPRRAARCTSTPGTVRG